jgi:hypothetical protein
MKKNYRDKHGKKIEHGMYLKHNDGDVSYVYQCANPDGEEDLGFNASNENHISFNEMERKIYPLYQFNMKEYEIVKPEELKENGK